MAKHHPDHEVLMDYASGHLREPLALLVATHLALCPKCRREVADMEALGGVVLEDIEPSAMQSESFDQLLAKIERGGQLERNASGASDARDKPGDSRVAGIVVPQPLRGYLGGSLEDLSWKRLSGSVSEARLLDEFDGYETRLLRIGAGARLPTHTHEGRELTLVLAGGFSDQFGHYLRGDVSVADTDITHQPIADEDGDCICLAVTDAPLRFTGAMGRILNLINRF